MSLNQLPDCSFLHIRLRMVMRTGFFSLQTLCWCKTCLSYLSQRQICPTSCRSWHGACMMYWKFIIVVRATHVTISPLGFKRHSVCVSTLCIFTALHALFCFCVSLFRKLTNSTYWSVWPNTV